VFENICNNAPVANAGQDQTVETGPDGTAEIILDCSDSNDPDGNWCFDGDCPDFFTHDIRPRKIVYGKNNEMTVAEAMEELKLINKKFLNNLDLLKKYSSKAKKNEETIKRLEA